MTDQAKALRLARPTAVDFPAAEPPRDAGAVVVGSGKGGVGKSLVAVTLATSLADAGRRVLLVDADFNLGNLHVLLGVRPTVAPEALMEPTTDPAAVIVPVRENLWLMPAASGSESVQRLTTHDRARLHRRVTGLYPQYDAVVVDAAAGLDSALRVAAMHASRMVLVTTPEPTALTSAYALVKMVHGRLPRLPIDLLLNRIVAEGEAEQAAARVHEACIRFLGRTIRYLGAVPEDPSLRLTLADPARLTEAAAAGAAQAAIHRIVATHLHGIGAPA
jgi:flagellar biosynthesis protein FlhG